jgi:PTH2 family peptidyl-tRNA hydrolase
MFKQVILIRKDLDMSTGKIAAQSCHASLGSYKKADKVTIKKWDLSGQKKVFLEVNTENEILKIYDKVKKEKIPNFLVKDAGLTELASGTITALGVGPDDEKKIDKITGSLKLA